MPPGIREFTTFADALLECDGLVFKGQRVVVPADARAEILQRRPILLSPYQRQRMPTPSKGSCLLRRNYCRHQENRKQLRILLRT